MLAAAPHRGSVQDSIVRGRCVLAVATTEEAGDAGLAAGDRFALAFTGALDNREALAKELGLEADAPRPRSCSPPSDAGRMRRRPTCAVPSPAS